MDPGTLGTLWGHHFAGLPKPCVFHGRDETIREYAAGWASLVIGREKLALLLII